MNEIRVSITELKNHWGKYLRKVESGQTILITRYGEPVAALIPISALPKERIQAMEGKGIAEWNGQ